MQIKPVIFGLAGPKLTSEEKKFLKSNNPLGIILFARNCINKQQITELTTEIKQCLDRENVLILVDQEGGRVARLRPPFFKNYPAAKFFADIAQKDISLAKEAAYINSRIMANELLEVGITVNCAPVVDLLIEGAHAIISDRSYGKEVEQVVELARSVCKGLLDGGVLPVIKHIPGHGRALVDSHESLPVVDTDIDVLKATDFEVFKQLQDFPLAMTAHIIYSAIDANLPATLSPKMLKVIREDIGFKGLIFSDDLSMKALTGNIGKRASDAIAAGCDVVLHCNGNMDEMQEIASSIKNHAGTRTIGFITTMYPHLKERDTDMAELEERLTNLVNWNYKLV